MKVLFSELQLVLIESPIRVYLCMLGQQLLPNISLI